MSIIYQYHLNDVESTYQQIRDINSELGRMPEKEIAVFDTYPRHLLLVAVKNGNIGEIETGFVGYNSSLSTVGETVKNIDGESGPVMSIRNLPLKPSGISADVEYCFVETATNITGKLFLKSDHSPAFCLGGRGGD